MTTTIAPAHERDQDRHHLLATGLTEADAHLLLDTLAAQFGWVYALWSRASVTSSLNANAQRLTRTLTDDEWNRITGTRAWTEQLPLAAYDAADNTRLLLTAIADAGLECLRCGTSLHEPPTVTGRLCPAHRTGPAGQPAVVDPDTATLYWLDGNTLMHWQPDADSWARPRTGLPYTGDPDADPTAHRRAVRADAALRLTATIERSPS
ncbi:hypothetical protein [Catenuloplanes atrovinosus]|uniref:Uncharacterized protein n=1 Tax=Catenuloplanes atrovinosus TaxID=137266 RepID=A0AAE4CB32_9ACTN|nr:hypothetical protein [Catenuloplanes atrovinosus]MDR7277632.1 hypothetical protein [Catenuloplanes atrovinosus]